MGGGVGGGEDPRPCQWDDPDDDLILTPPNLYGLELHYTAAIQCCSLSIPVVALG